jgi:hypothetical protein
VFCRICAKRFDLFGLVVVVSGGRCYDFKIISKKWIKCCNLVPKLDNNIGFQENRNFFAENCDYNIDPSSVAGIVLICPILMSLKLAKHEFLHFTHFPCVPLISHYGIGRHNMYVCTYIVDTIHNLT